ncbi:LuxR C-terminal-related transcriptional regulator [Chloroflexi bacterium TSY]|nr:LuxR C-terminal-related transcriptional regulator [Chloroflexi bacterium TSY]
MDIGIISTMQALLRTKLFIPPAPPEAIPRSHLVERLNLGLTGKLSLITAPAGYGKTTLVTTWLHNLGPCVHCPQVVWLSLDKGDNEVRRFFTYFVAALCQLDESFETIQEAFLQDPHSELSADAIVTRLLNLVVSYGQPAVLVLDDYHEIEEPSIHEALAFWLDNQPPNFHLAITSRTEPPLPLSRMRVRRQVTEIDAEALRFSRSESADFLNQHMQLNLSADDIDQLDSITEGWVASLQLAALSLQNKDDPTEFIQTFKGDNRYIVDYLVTEVLYKQPGYIRDFLLQTSILERLNVQLCNAVTEQVGSQHILETLDRTRLFLIPLDDRRHWYRYHHLFAECLQAELQRTASEDVSTYHERASRWFSSHGFLGDSIQHALAAGNSGLAARLIADNAGKILWEQGETHRPWQWIQQLPDEEIGTSPRLLITKAWLYQELFLDQGTHVDELLDDAESLVHVSDAPHRTEEVAELVTEIALARSNLNRLRGNLKRAIQYCEYAWEQIQDVDSPLRKTGVLHSLAISHHQAGNVVQSLKYSTTQFEFLGQGEPLDYAHYVSLAYRVDALRLQGKLQQAGHVLQQIESNQLQRQNLGAAMVAVSWAEVLRERNQLTLAVDTLIPALEMLKPQQSMAAVVQTGAITLARILQTQGKGQEALKLLIDTLRDFRASDTYYPSARISATEALLHLQQGNLSAAKAWAEKSGMQADDALAYLFEIDYLVLARLLIADGAAHAAQLLLGRLEKAITDGGRVARLVEVRILQALAHQGLGATGQAIDQLEQAINLAQPEGFARVFVDEGDALVPLLKQVAGRGLAISYIRQLLHLVDEGTKLQTPFTKTATTEQLITEPNTTDVESDSLNLLLNPLTNRELATLRYLASDLTIPEIAEQMVVAPSTIRTYVKGIYGKLDVHTRIEAVNRARSLALIV